MIVLSSESGQTKYGLKKYLIDSYEDLKSLSIKNTPAGSSALSMSDGKVYFLIVDESAAEGFTWKQMPISGGGGGGGGGSVNSVNDIEPDADGNVEITGDDIRTEKRGGPQKISDSIAQKQNKLVAGSNVKLEDVDSGQHTLVSVPGVITSVNGKTASNDGSVTLTGDGINVGSGPSGTIFDNIMDLKNNKQNKLYDSGNNQNIKTINGQSLLGSGDI